VQGFSRAAAIVVLAGALIVAPAAQPAPPSDFQAVKRGLAQAVAREWLDSFDAGHYGAIAYRAARVIPRLPGSRAANLAAVLRDVAAQRAWYTPPRALALFSMLDLNTTYLARRGMPPERTDVYDTDGVLYRAFPGRGLQFHPLGNFGRLAGLAIAGRDLEAGVLAQALLDRGVPRGSSLTWEYYFPFGGGTAPWTSGMAQAVAASALARVDLPSEARRAYLAIYRGLLTWPRAGPWIRLYSFSPVLVLNAQLQTAFSLEVYARLSGDTEAASLAGRLRTTAGALLPGFDTGAWSRYALGGAEASLEYHRYVVDLLELLAEQTGDATWDRWQGRFDAYLHQPPVISARRPVPAVADRRPARISFWLSKLSRVTLSVAGEASVAWRGRGFHTLTWSPGRHGGGSYRAFLVAQDPAGNRTRVDLAPVVVRRR
jgi:hypothetical protein